MNSQGEQLGKVKEIMLDVETGKIAYMVLSFGGMLGLGINCLRFPLINLKSMKIKKAVVIDADKMELEKAPGFDKDHWPDFNDVAWNENIFSYYKSNPYWREK